MRTTLSIDDDVIHAARALADHQGTSLGAMISKLARQSLEKPPEPFETKNGLPLLPRRGHGLVTLEMVNALRDE
ncbi:hypothetical protein JI666_21245, partial [Bacillus sp. NTK071]|uniref:DUF6364 family protein n=1 Tax=Bacillus sp. NTK071 TaxID=2802175 RepID=UPI001A8F5E95